MKVVKEQPQEGAYVAVWNYDGEFYCTSYKWDEEDPECLMEYNERDELWEYTDGDLSLVQNLHFIIQE